MYVVVLLTAAVSHLMEIRFLLKFHFHTKFAIVLLQFINLDQVL